MFRQAMPFPKRWILLLSLFAVGFITWLFRPLLQLSTSAWLPGPEVGTREELARPDNGQKQTVIDEKDADNPQANSKPVTKNPFQPGTVKPVGVPYTKTLVITRTSEEDVSWVAENFDGDEFIKAAIYTVDDVNAELHPPKNKGHEVMVYLTYIIDHYHNLSDVNIFMHSHRHSWHNNELLDHDAVQMIFRLSAERVQREGYMNMRCSWEPGCPSWMHPGTVEEDINKQEETMFARSWSELFPRDPIPNVLAQPCCAQFALSRDRIQALPLASFVFYRDWLLGTTLSDYISGRVWEYVWHFLFTGKAVVCPAEHICNCDGFGVCFGGEEKYAEFLEKRHEHQLLEEDVKWHHEGSEKWEESPETLTPEEKARGPPDEAKVHGLELKINELSEWCDKMKQEARERGDLAMYRAQEAGRVWKEGDGF